MGNFSKRFKRSSTSVFMLLIIYTRAYTDRTKRAYIFIFAGREGWGFIKCIPIFKSESKWLYALLIGCTSDLFNCIIVDLSNSLSYWLFVWHSIFVSLFCTPLAWGPGRVFTSLTTRGKWW